VELEAPVDHRMCISALGSLATRFPEHPAVVAGGEDGLFDFTRRIKELEDDGIVADVVINQSIPFSPPFIDALPSQDDWSVRKAGIRAANEWLVDRCNEHPGRHAGLAIIPDMDDIAASARQIDDLFARGLKGGICCPTARATSGRRGTTSPTTRCGKCSITTRCRCTRTSARSSVVPRPASPARGDF
jgi:hypothetical protein